MEDKVWIDIASYLAGEADKETENEMEEKMKTDEQFKSHIEEISREMEMVENIHKMKEFNTDKAFGNLKQKLEVNGLLPEIKPQKTIPMFMKTAAIIVVAVGLGIVALVQFGKFNLSGNYASFYANNANEIKKVSLPDGTVVFLNYQSKIVLSDGFENGVRRVNLHGEAYFDVARDTTKPFVINVENAQIQVLGTSFNVKNNPKENQVEVLVETGKVSLSDKTDNTRNITLTKGDLGILHQKVVTKSTNSQENYLAWKTRKLVFKSKSIEDVAKVIEDVYHVELEIDNQVKNCTLTSTFNNNTLPEILESIKETIQGIDFEIKNKKVILVGDGC